MSIEQEKLNRLLKIIFYLRIPHGRTIELMAEDLDVSTRTVRRYLNLLEENGFPIEKALNSNRWFIVPEVGGDKNLLNFSIDEAVLIRDLVQNGAANHPLKVGILQKLYINSDLKPLADNIVKSGGYIIVNKLRKAIKSELKVNIFNYRSVSSKEIKNYFIEPIKFSENFSAVYAYDLEDKCNKQFLTNRMGKVHVTDLKQSHFSKHDSFMTDAFGYTGDEKINIRLKLDLASATIITEVYPKAEKFMTKIEDHYIFEGSINQVEGAGRFILSQIGNVEILEGDNLIEYVQNKLVEFNVAHHLKPS